MLGFSLKVETYRALADTLLLTDMTVYIYQLFASMCIIWKEYRLLLLLYLVLEKIT